MMIKSIGTVIGVISLLSFLLLAFAFRDFSLVLLLQSILTLFGICLATYLLTKKPEITFGDEEEIEGLEGRFSLTNY